MTTSAWDRERMRVIALVAALATLSGCSFIFVRGVNTDHPEGCNSSRAAPVTDLVLTTAELALAAGLIMVDESPTCWKSNCETHEGDNTKPGMVVGSLSIVQLSSAFVGFSRTSQCRKALADQQKQLQQAPYPYYAPHPAYP